eukprot:TRINITY_DN1725_c0_g1_i2.p1 TRINITY_DN1725_c0_g1~~TRINITY_DN1725_c0_g1_i2.p1  ORF type:complete len:265 (-),score=43.87 TRINITY_DN1725_c0_g1_i2:161-955(-)
MFPFWNRSAPTPVPAAIAPATNALPLQLQPLSTSTSVLLYNIAPSKSYDRTFLSSFSPEAAAASASYTSDTVDITSSVSLRDVSFRTRIKTPSPMYSRMPNMRRLRNDFAGVKAVITFFDATSITEPKLASVLNRKIRSAITLPKVPIAFVLDSNEDQMNKPVMESFCAANQVNFFCIDLSKPEQVVSVVQKILSDIVNQAGVTPAQPTGPYNASLFPQLQRQAPKLPQPRTNLVGKPTEPINKPTIPTPALVMSGDGLTFSAA